MEFRPPPPAYTLHQRSFHLLCLSVILKTERAGEQTLRPYVLHGTNSQNDVCQNPKPNSTLDIVCLLTSLLPSFISR